MHQPTHVRRVIVVVLDGLRPDAIEAFDLVNVRQLMQLGASSLTARTVSPSLTWPALTSLLTGVDPSRHGILSDTLHLPKQKSTLRPMPELLMRSGFPCSAFLGDVPAVYRIFGTRIGEKLGFNHVRFGGQTAPEVLLKARKHIQSQRHGLIFMHWADADRAGHAHGWMSPRYGQAACGIDTALGMLAATVDIESDPHTVIVALADHGGGGIDERNHEGDHPLNTTIPLAIAGGGIQPRGLGAVNLLDLPPTILGMFGLRVPATYCGRTLSELFETLAESAA